MDQKQPDETAGVGSGTSNPKHPDDENVIESQPTLGTDKGGSAVFEPIDEEINSSKTAENQEESASPDISTRIHAVVNPFEGVPGEDFFEPTESDVSDEPPPALAEPLLMSDSGRAPLTEPERLQPSVNENKEEQNRQLLLTIAVSWASLATIIAFWLWWNSGNFPSNLENMPDDGALQSLRGKELSPVEPLGERSTLRLGETRRFGDIQVTPVGIEYKKIRVLLKGNVLAYEPYVLELKLRIKNLSKNQSFHPMDPAFLTMVKKGSGPRRTNRIIVNGVKIFEDGYSYTFAHPVGSIASIEKRILPLDINLPQGERIDGQEFPHLQPGEEKEVVAHSQEDALAKVKGPMVWRVKLRKGKTTGGLGVATVIGVQFNLDDIVIKHKPPNRLSS